MNTELFYLALSQMVLSILLAIIIFYISYTMLIKIFNLKGSDINDSNLALSIFFSGIIFSTGYLLSGIIPSIIDAVKLLKIHSKDNLFMEVLKYASVSLFVGFMLAILIHLSSFVLVKSLTRHIKEMEELKRQMAIR